MGGLVIYEEYDGYIGKVPYSICEYRERDVKTDPVELVKDVMKELTELTSFQKLVYMFFHHYSLYSDDENFTMLFIRVSLKKVAEYLCVSIDEIKNAVDALEEMQYIMVLREEGKINAYVVTRSR